MAMTKKFLAVCLALVMAISLLPMQAFATEAATAETAPAADTSNQFVIMSTTDVHGNVWDYNLLSQSNVKNSLLNTASAVADIREDFGDRTVLVDNGDLFQGTPVSSNNINALTLGTTTDPNPMAIALKYMDYDGLMMGNHEFNYNWNTMSKIYDYLRSEDTGNEKLNNHVEVVAINMYWETGEKAGQRVFEPSITKTFKIGGEDFTVMVIGIDNTDCPRWDVPDNYPNMIFSHPDNPNRDMAWELNHYLEEVKDVPRDFTIVSYHSGLGAGNEDLDTLTFGTNTENQILRIIKNTEGIDMVIAGHDHSASYSGSKYPNKAGKDVLVVNAAQTTLTKSVFEAKKGDDGKWVVTQVTPDEVGAHNLDITTYPVDETLKAMIQPYADSAAEFVNEVAGKLVGKWDGVSGSGTMYLKQCDTTDLIGRAQIAEGTEYLKAKYASVDEINAKLKEIYGEDTKKQLTGDEIIVDFSSTSVVTKGDGHAEEGDISIADIYTFYRYDNSLYLMALTGQEIKDFLEYNAKERIDAKVVGGELKTGTKGEDFTHPVFYGLNFTYDMAQPEGSRAVIGDFSNGKKFDLNETYIFAINNYHLGNAGNPNMAKLDTTQQIWSQNDDLGGGTVQDMIANYVKKLTEKDGGVYPNSEAKDGKNANGETICTWSISYSGDMSAVALPDTTEVIGAEMEEIQDGVPMLLYHDGDGAALSATPNGEKMSISEASRIGNRLYAGADAAIITPVKVEGGWNLKVGDGYLTYPPTGNGLSVETAATEYSLWEAKTVDGGVNFICVNASYQGNSQALEIYSGKFTTYGYGSGGPAFTFKAYNVVTTGKLATELKDGDKVAIVNPGLNLAIAGAGDGKMNSGAAYATATETGGVAELPADATVFEVSHDASGNLLLKAEGGYLTYPASGNGLSLAAEATDLSAFDLEAASGTGVFNIHATNAAYNGNANQYVEQYKEQFTTYGINGGGVAYEYSFYTVAVKGTDAAEEPKNDAPEAPIEGYVVDVFSTSDVHGSLIDTSSGDPAKYQYLLAYIADKVNDARKTNPDGVLLLDAGDIYQANVVSNLQNGMPMMAAYDLMKYDAVALGNHEFDWGVETVIDDDATIGKYDFSGYVGDSKIPVVTSNITLNGEPAKIAQPYVIVEKTATDAAGKTITVKIGILGFADDYAKDIMAAKFTERGYKITEDAAALEALAVKLETELGCDAVVLLGHADGGAMANMLVEGTVIDLVLGGHSHSGQTGETRGIVYMQPKNAAANYCNAKLVFQADADGKVTGVSVAKNNIVVVTDNKDKLVKTDANVGTELDPDMVKLSDAAVANVADALNTVLGAVDTNLTKDGIDGNGMSSTAGNWMSGLMAKAVGADVGFTNNGGIRTTLVMADGATTRNITVGDVYTIAPFGNLIYAYEVTYPEFLTIVEFAVGSGSGMGLRMSGINAYYNNEGKVTALTLLDGTLVYQNGTWAPGYETKTIKVATNEYVATSDTPFKAWNDTAKLYSNTLADNESMIEELTAEGEANGGKLAVDAAAHLIAGAYTGTGALAPETPPATEPEPLPTTEPDAPLDTPPQTGDVSMIIWVVAALCSASGIAVLKRREEE